MASFPPQGSLNANHDRQIISVIAVFSAFSFTALILRLVSKRIKRVAFDYDDYLVIISWARPLTRNVDGADFAVRYSRCQRVRRPFTVSTCEQKSPRPQKYPDLYRPRD